MFVFHSNYHFTKLYHAIDTLTSCNIIVVSYTLPLYKSEYIRLKKKDVDRYIDFRVIKDTPFYFMVQ